jgi:hypothetical protein
MKPKQILFSFGLAGGLFLALAGIASASTTIGTSINTGGNLTVTGHSVFGADAVIDQTNSDLFGSHPVVLNVGEVATDPTTALSVASNALTLNLTGNSSQEYTAFTNGTFIPNTNSHNIARAGAEYITTFNLGSGDVTGYMYGSYYDVENSGSGHASSLIGQLITAATNGSATTDNQYGLQITDVTGGTNNYAIKTGAGMVEVGDATKAAGIHVQGGGAFGSATPGLTQIWSDIDNSNLWNETFTNRVAGLAHYSGISISDLGDFALSVDQGGSSPSDLQYIIASKQWSFGDSLSVAGTTTLSGALSLEKGTGTISTNGVTINKTSGVITDSTDIATTSTRAAITLTNSRIIPTSVVVGSICSTPDTGAMLGVSITPGAGTATIKVYNAGTTAETSDYKICFIVTN